MSGDRPKYVGIDGMHTDVIGEMNRLHAEGYRYLFTIQGYATIDNVEPSKIIMERYLPIKPLPTAPAWPEGMPGNNLPDAS